MHYISVCTSDNISGMIWTVEQIGGLVKSVSPGLPPNWSVVQELTKLSCVNPTHLRQTLLSLSVLGEIWQTNIVIVMTLQQHFARFSSSLYLLFAVFVDLSS